jgi:hypothetical protein
MDNPLKWIVLPVTSRHRGRFLRRSGKIEQKISIVPLGKWAATYPILAMLQLDFRWRAVMRLLIAGSVTQIFSLVILRHIVLSATPTYTSKLLDLIVLAVILLHIG